MLSQSLSYLQQSPQQFNIQEVLLSLCKKSTLDSQSPQIDFLDFEQKLQNINSFHEKTCQEIVEFVDTHFSQYIEINGKFQQLQDKVSKVEGIIKSLSIKLKDYAKVYYMDQGKIQQMISKYETSIIEKLLLKKCKEQTVFLSKFVLMFQSISSKSMDKLTFKQRAILIRFCYKFNQLESLFNHHLLHQTLPEYIKIYEMIYNLVDQVEFYISEQLSKLIKFKLTTQNEKDPRIVALNQIKMCYTYLNKLPEYYKNIEQNLIGREMQIAEKNLINDKINLIGGKNLQIIEDFFKAIFNSIKQFPKTYPRSRILELIYTQLKKNQVKFLYTYTLPIFPISYNCYLKFVNSLEESQVELKEALRLNHNWDLKRWVDVREKNILDRCGKDWDVNGKVLKTDDKPDLKLSCPDLNKWIDIIFKENCKIDGVKNEIVKLSIKVVNKFAIFIQSCQRFDTTFMNKCMLIFNNIQQLMQEKLALFYDVTQQSSQQLKSLAKKISLSCKLSIQKAIDRIIEKNTKLLSKSCSGTLESFKSYIMKVIKSSKELTQFGMINLSSTVFKPLGLFLQNNGEMSEDFKKWVRKVVLKDVMLFYDQHYVPEIYQYAKNNLSVEQLSEVMQVIGKQRASLFVEIQTQK